jgi:hypothetical protein
MLVVSAYAPEHHLTEFILKSAVVSFFVQISLEFRNSSFITFSLIYSHISSTDGTVSSVILFVPLSAYVFCRQADPEIMRLTDWLTD